MNVTTGEALRKLRLQHGYTTRQIGTIIGVPEDEVELWERTASYPEPEKLVALATLFKKSLDEIVS